MTKMEQNLDNITSPQHDATAIITAGGTALTRSNSTDYHPLAVIYFVVGLQKVLDGEIILTHMSGWYCVYF